VLEKEDLAHFEIVETLDHDTASFTEGLFIHDGIMYESTGLWGKSKLISRQMSSQEVLQTSDLPGNDFGEGIALVGTTITQLTYQSGNVYKYSEGNFEDRTVRQLPNKNVIKEGWGMTTDGHVMYVSDGSSTLFVLDPNTMRIKSSIPVRYRGFPISNLNELEIVGPFIYANIFMTDCAIKIHAETGQVQTWIRKGSGFYQTANAGVDVMNGIAYDHDTSKLYVTGKNWPHLYAVRVVTENAPSNSDLDTFCLHRSMSLVDFSVLVTLMRPSSPSTSTDSVPMPGLETTVSKSSAGPSSEQVRDFFESHQAYFQLPASPRALVDVALGTDTSSSPKTDGSPPPSSQDVSSSLLEASDEPAIDEQIQTMFLRDYDIVNAGPPQPMFSDALYPI